MFEIRYITQTTTENINDICIIFIVSHFASSSSTCCYQAIIKILVATFVEWKCHTIENELCYNFTKMLMLLLSEFFQFLGCILNSYMDRQSQVSLTFCILPCSFYRRHSSCYLCVLLCILMHKCHNTNLHKNYKPANCVSCVLLNNLII